MIELKTVKDILILEDTSAQTIKDAIENASKWFVNLSGVDLSWEDLDRAYLPEARLTDAYMRSVSLNTADLSGADLARANLYAAGLRGTDFSRADLRGANLRYVDATGADFTEANLRGADFTGAMLRDADFTGADIIGACFADADLTGADIFSDYKVAYVSGQPSAGKKETKTMSVIKGQIEEKPSYTVGNEVFQTKSEAVRHLLKDSFGTWYQGHPVPAGSLTLPAATFVGWLSAHWHELGEFVDFYRREIAVYPTDLKGEKNHE